jgi:translation initiation factor IF-3
MPAPKDGPRINEEIRVREVQLIDQTGHNHGPTDIQAAIAMAQEAGLDLVEIAPNSNPPVCNRDQGDQAPADDRRPRL